MSLVNILLLMRYQADKKRLSKLNGTPPTPQEKNMLSENQTDQRKKNDPVWVYFWSTTSRGVGHASFQIGGDSPKLTADQAGKYHGILPLNMAVYGPLMIAPLKATLSDTVTSDALLEAPKDHTFDQETPNLSSEFSAHTTKRMPDRVYKFSNLNTDIIQREMQQIEEKVQSGHVRYQLLPHITLFSGMMNTLNSISSRTIDTLSADPFAELPTPHVTDYIKKLPRERYSVFNCTRLTRHYLEKGGAQLPPISRIKWPWGITPTGLANQIANDPNAEEIDISSYTKRKL